MFLRNVGTYLSIYTASEPRRQHRYQTHIDFTIKTRLAQIQGDRNVTQHMLKYLLKAAIQYNSTGLINTQYRCEYTRAHAGHVML
jgi:hypothetical protein